VAGPNLRDVSEQGVDSFLSQVGGCSRERVKCLNDLRGKVVVLTRVCGFHGREYLLGEVGPGSLGVAGLPPARGVPKCRVNLPENYEVIL